MSRSRAPLFLGLTAAGGVGYYLYNSGGNAKAAEKQFEADVHKVSAKVKGEAPRFEKDAEKFGANAGAKIDSAVSFYAKATATAVASRRSRDSSSSSSSSSLVTLMEDRTTTSASATTATALPPILRSVAKTNAEFSKAKSEAEAYAKEAKASALKKVDDFDRAVEKDVSKAKSGISSWFGGK